MNLRDRTTRGLALVTVLLLTAAAAGCIGEDDAPAETASEDQDLEDANASAEDEQPATDGEEDGEASLEERAFPIEGSGTGWGFEPQEGTCINCFWVQSSGAIQSLTVPDTYEDASIEFAWEGGQSLGGMWLWVRDADASTVHVFHVSESPFEVDLEADDGRLQGAAEVIVLPADTPAAAHVNVEWTGAVTFLVPQDGGSDIPGPGS